jgi:hypothetical protein
MAAGGEDSVLMGRYQQLRSILYRHERAQDDE